MLEEMQPGQRLARGVARHLTRQHGFVSVEEFVPARGLRVDVMGLGPKGEIWVIECKSSRADFQSDSKWQGYLEWCDRYFWAVDLEFPTDLLPEGTGLILPPVFGGLAPLTVKAGDTIQVVVTATDPNGDSIALTADSLPSGASFVDAGDGSGTLTWNPWENQVGSYVVNIVASDGQAQTVGNLPITVLPPDAPNEPPVAASAVIAVQALMASAPVIPSVTDPDQATGHTIAIVSPGQLGTAHVENGALIYTHTSAAILKSDSFTFSATDAFGASVVGTAAGVQ